MLKAYQLKLLILLVSLLIEQNLAQYETSEKVKELNSKDLNNIIEANGDDLWMIQIYELSTLINPMIKTFNEMAKSFDGFIKAGVINVDKYPLLRNIYKLEELPAVMFLTYYKAHDYEMMDQELAKPLKKRAREIVMELLHNRSLSKYIANKWNYELEFKIGEQSINKSRHAWGVIYYSTLCKDCIDFAPIWSQLVTNLGEKVRFAAIRKIIQGDGTLPVIKYYPRGNNLKYPAVTYEGPRDLKSITDFFLAELKPLHIKEIIDSESLNRCIKRKYCIVAFLPDHKFCNEDCINGYLDLLRTFGTMYKHKLWGVLWTQYGRQQDLKQYFILEDVSVPSLFLVHVPTATYEQYQVGANYSIDDLDKVGQYLLTRPQFGKELILEPMPNIKRNRPYGLMKVKEEL